MTARGALRRHWPEYVIEAACLGLFMISACSFAVLFEHPSSPVPHLVPAPLRRVLMGLAMGSTAVAIVYSRWGKRSGAHINPAITLSFFRLGKVEPWDAAFYVLFQFLGAGLGVTLAAGVLGAWVANPHVNYVATQPGAGGSAAAFAAELLMAFVLMTVVLYATNAEKLARYTGIFAGVLVATYITLLAPVSGMSINPARTFGSALPARLWHFLWIYFTAPPLGMLAAAELHRLRRRRVVCAKLHHDNDERCIFRCGYAGARPAP